jgi:hypothetical protein
MSDPRRVLASLCALLAASAVLVADSAEPECASYKPFELSFDYSTDCLGGDSGILEVASHGQATLHGRAMPEDVQIQASGALEFGVVDVSYDRTDCPEDGEGVGVFNGLVLSLGAASDTASASYTCSGWLGDATDQALDCVEDGSLAHCQLLLTPRS